MLVVFVHGWGVRRPDYGSLPDRVRQLCGADVLDVWLSEYISYCDELTVDDLATAFERARLHIFPNRAFAGVTHSTGGVVMRAWLLRYSGPMTHLVMLAPPTHGSALAQLGKSRLSRMKSWIEGAEPSQRILDCLELGSEQIWNLNRRWLDFDWQAHATFPFTLTGAAPDRTLYDHLNSYTGERGSDGVVRACAANLNFQWLRLEQGPSGAVVASAKRSTETAFGIVPGISHAGILASALTAKWVARCLGVSDPSAYQRVVVDLQSTADHEPKRCSMAVFRVNASDYDVLLTAGPDHSPDALPRGFLLDRQRNTSSGALTFYFDDAAMDTVTNLGFRITPRPTLGPVNYRPLALQGTAFLRRHETTWITVSCERRLQPQVFSVTADCV